MSDEGAPHARRNPLALGPLDALDRALLATVALGAAASLAVVWRRLPAPEVDRLARWLGDAPSPLLQRLAASLALLATPVALALLARRLGRSPRLIVLAMPLALHVALGLPAWSLALPASLVALALLDAAAETPSPARAGAALAAAVATTLLHPLAGALFALFGAPICLARALDRRAAPRALGLTVAAALFAGGALLSRFVVLPRLVRFGVESQIERLRQLAERLCLLRPGRVAAVLLVVTAATWLLVAGSARPARRARHPDDRGLAPGVGAWLPEICFVLAAVAYLALPRDVGPRVGGLLAPRLLAPAALLGALLLRGPLDGRRRLLLLPAAAAAALYPLAIALGLP